MSFVTGSVATFDFSTVFFWVEMFAAFLVLTISDSVVRADVYSWAGLRLLTRHFYLNYDFLILNSFIVTFPDGGLPSYVEQKVKGFSTE